MRLEWLEYFTKITPNKSLRQISEELFLSQQTLSSAIQGLEKEFGCQLLIRHRSGNVQFTQQGTLLKTATLEYLKKIDGIKHPSLMSGTINILALSAIARSFLQAKIISFQKQYPTITFNIHYCANVKKLLDLFLTENLYDFSIISEVIVGTEYKIDFPSLAQRNNLVYTPIASESFYIEIHETLLRNVHKKNKLYLKDLSSLTCFAYMHQGADLDATKRILKCCSCTSDFKAESLYEIYIMNLINKNGYGLLGPANNIYSYSSNEIIRIPLKDDISYEYAIISKNSDLSPVAQEFIDTISANTY